MSKQDFLFFYVMFISAILGYIIGTMMLEKVAGVRSWRRNYVFAAICICVLIVCSLDYFGVIK